MISGLFPHRAEQTAVNQFTIHSVTLKYFLVMCCILKAVCCLCVQVVILERRNAAGKAFFKPVTAWNGSEEDKQSLLEELERLQKDPSILVHDAILPELNNEFASVRSL